MEYPAATKWLLVKTYRSYCKTFKIDSEPIKVQYEPKVPYIPTEQECMEFIAGLSKRLSILCRILFETGARISEACKVEWTDINESACTVAINHPSKGSKAGVLKVSRECIDLVKRLPKKHGNYILNPVTNGYYQSCQSQRARMADKLGKPQFVKIHFHTFRHVRGTSDVHN